MRRWLPILMLFTALLARADDRADELTAAGIAEFTAAYQAWDGQRFAAAAELFRQATTNTPGSSTNFRKVLAQHPADHVAKEGLARITEDK